MATYPTPGSTTPASSAVADISLYQRIGAAAALLMAIGGGAWAASLGLYSDLSFREVVREPLVVTASWLVAVAAAVLASQLMPATASSGLPRWAVALTAIGFVLVAGFGLAMGSLAVHMAGVVSDDVFEESSFALDMLGYAKIPFLVLGFLGLAVASYKKKLVHRACSGLLVLAAVAALIWPFAPVSLVGGLALLWLLSTSRSQAFAAGRQ